MYSNEIEMLKLIFAGFSIIALTIFLILLAISILTIVGKWKALKKAGKAGWEALIPGYRLYVLCEISGLNPWWSIVYILGIIFIPLLPIVGPLLSITIIIYFKVIFCLSISRSFGKIDAFAIGLWFLPPIFWFLLGIKDVQYEGPKPIDPLYDAIFGEKINNHESYNKYKQNENTKFCTECGSRIPADVKYCPNCGKEIEK